MTSFILHIIAIVTMLIDHIGIIIFPEAEWLRYIGRLAFPIFSFLIIEGYFHTSNIKKYLKRLFIFAIISEIPFNLMIMGEYISSYQQNVLWTFLISLILIHLNETNKEAKAGTKFSIIGVTILLAIILGTIVSCDYRAAGILTVLVFYYFREKNIMNFILQVFSLRFLYTEVLKTSGIMLPFTSIIIPMQSFALISLIFIWLYKGEQGPYNKQIKQLYYWFYPAHILILLIIEKIFFI